MPQYYVKSADSDYSEVEETALDNMDIIQYEENYWHYIHNNVTYKIQLTNADYNAGQYAFLINGKEHHIEVKNDLEIMVLNMGMSADIEKFQHEIISPMPGIALDILVKEGDVISENSDLLILEAMKMENIIKAPNGGIIKKIEIVKGDTVDKNQLLIEIDKHEE